MDVTRRFLVSGCLVLWDAVLGCLRVYGILLRLAFAPPIAEPRFPTRNPVFTLVAHQLVWDCLPSRLHDTVEIYAEYHGSDLCMLGHDVFYTDVRLHDRCGSVC